MNKEVVVQILAKGGMAPSGDNVQPWRIKVLKNGFKLFIHHETDDFFDITYGASYLDAGLFLENVRLAAKKEGYGIKVLFGSKKDVSFIGTVTFVKIDAKSALEGYDFDSRIYDAIPKRACIRTKMRKIKLPMAFHSEVAKFSKCVFLDPTPKVNSILYSADVIRYETREAHNTLRGNIKVSDAEISAREGLDYRTMGLPFPQKLVVGLIKNFSFAKTFKYIMAIFSTTVLVKNSAGVGVIPVTEFSKERYVLLGMEWQRIWLLLASYGAYLHPYATLPFFMLNLNHGKRIAFGREPAAKIKELARKLLLVCGVNPDLEIGIVFRYGYSKAPKVRSLRRSIRELIIE